MVNGEWEEFTEYEEMVIRKRAADMARRSKGEWEDRWESHVALVGDDVEEDIQEEGKILLMLVCCMTFTAG